MNTNQHFPVIAHEPWRDPISRREGVLYAVVFAASFLIPLIVILATYGVIW